MKKAIFLDLDNTVYPVASIGEVLFAPLFKLIDDSGEFTGEIQDVRNDIMRKPFQLVADIYHFSEHLRNSGIELLAELEYNQPVLTFPDYAYIRAIELPRFLVTTGFEKMQRSKVSMLGIGPDFEEVHIVDPAVSNLTKRDVFQDILNPFQWDSGDVVVIGDDPGSEIAAAHDLGIETVLYTRAGVSSGGGATHVIGDFSELAMIFGW